MRLSAGGGREPPACVFRESPLFQASDSIREVETDDRADLSRFLEAVPAPGAAFDRSGGLLATNEAWQSLFARELGDDPVVSFPLLNTRLSEVAGGNDLGLSLSELSQGRERTVLLDRGTVLCLRGGSLDDSVSLCWIEDVTEAARRERLFDEFERLVTGGAWSLNLVTGELVFSDGVWRVLGSGAKAAMSTLDAWIAHTDPADREELVRRIEYAVSNLQPYEHEYRIHPPGGMSRIIHARGNVVGNERGEPMMAMGVFRDVTQEREIQAELNQAQKVKALGQLASGVAHDFNNVLTAILGNAELLRMTLNGESEAAGWADEISRAARHAAELTRRLLSVVRRERTTSETVDVNELCDQVAALLGRSIDRRIEVELDLAAAPALIVGDPAQITSALLNLGINAAEAMPEGGRLTMTSEVVDVDASAAASLQREPASYVRVTVADSGVGIDRQTLERVFDPFYSTKSEGTGLGLATVSACAASHDGAVDVHSSPGQGTRFSLYLPLPERVSPMPAGGPEPSLARPGVLRVLVVDDEPSVAGFCRNALQSLGHVAGIENNASRLVVSLTQGESLDVDLVILDLNMPGMNGEDLLAELRRHAPGVRVLVSSGHADNATRDRLIGLGAAGFLPKPYRIRDLDGAISRAWADEHLAPAADD